MSVEFDATSNDFISDGTYATTFNISTSTFGCRFYLDSSQTRSTARVYTIGDRNISLYIAGGGLYCQFRDGSNVQTPQQQASISTQTWHSCIVKIESNTRYSTWLDGTKIKDDVGIGGAVSFSGVTASLIDVGGRTGVSDQSIDGFLSDFCFWDGRLDDTSCLAYSNGFSPQMLGLDLLSTHWKGLTDVYADEFQVADFTATGTPTISLDNNPAVIFPE